MKPLYIKISAAKSLKKGTGMRRLYFLDAELFICQNTGECKETYAYNRIVQKARDIDICRHQIKSAAEKGISGLYKPVEKQKQDKGKKDRKIWI